MELLRPSRLDELNGGTPLAGGTEVVPLLRDGLLEAETLVHIAPLLPREIAEGHSDLSSRTEQQAASLEETASSMQELATTVKQNAESAREANKLANGTSQTASKGGAVRSWIPVIGSRRTVHCAWPVPTWIRTRSSPPWRAMQPASKAGWPRCSEMSRRVPI